MGQKSDKKAALVTFGCRVNQTETERLWQGLAGEGYALAGDDEQADLVVVNTCSVTAESDRQARQAIRRARRRHPQARIVVTGCYAQRDPAALAALPGVDWVVGNPDKGALPALLQQGGERLIRVSPVTSVPAPPEASLPPTDEPGTPAVERARGILQVQTGCDEQCTFCLIPGVRGPSRSLPMAELLEQARLLLGRGFAELVLTGVNLGAYGRDLSPRLSLADLLAGLLALPGQARFRLSSLDPLAVDEPLVALMSEARRFCPHLHLSVQAGDSLILKRMGRHYNRELVLERAAQLRRARPEVVLGADLIVGFPTESETAFEHTLALVRAAELSLLHVFRYSDRPNTPAAAIPRRFRVGDEAIRDRSARLRQQGAEVLAGVLARQPGRTLEMLVETVGPAEATGKSEGFLPLLCRTPGLAPGQLLPVRVVAVEPLHGALRVLPTD